ncbi:MAG: TetR/AcrR family transcriptional regulator [Ignavibacteria bacterium]|nr:TetR/AcrR family transcriptional regulator [Ignavibacteria bacterium]
MPASVNKSAKRQDIIRYAADVFSKKGYNESKMQEIANAADIGKGTIYEYFRTKEELFLAVYDAWMSDYENVITDRVNAAQDALSKVDAIRDSAVEFYQSRAGQAPLILEFWAHALRTDNPLFLERINKTRTFLKELGARLTSDLVAAGWFNKVDAKSFALLESGFSDGIFLSWVLDAQSFPLDKAFTLRQSIIGLGLLSRQAREVLQERLEAKLAKGIKTS